MTTLHMLMLTSALVSQHDHGGAAAPPATEHAGHTSHVEGVAPEIALTPDQIRAVGLQTEKVTLRDFARVIRAVASVTADERKVAHIHTKVSGYIEALYVDYVGRQVNRGDRLMDLYSPEVLAAQSEWITALKQVDDARKRGASESELQSRNALANAARQRLKLWDIDDRILNDVQKTRKARRTITFYSPISGTVVMKEAVKGLYVGPDAHLFVVADLKAVWVVADIYAQEIEDVMVGMPAVVSIEGSSVERTGRIEFVSPTVQPSTRTVTVRVSLDNADGALKPGAFGSLGIQVHGHQGLAISDQAVLLTGQRAVVFVQTGEGRFQARDIQLGRRIPGFVEVKAGLKAEDAVVVSAQFVLDAETQLRGGPSGHAGHGG